MAQLENHFTNVPVQPSSRFHVEAWLPKFRNREMDYSLTAHHQSQMQHEIDLEHVEIVDHC